MTGLLRPRGESRRYRHNRGSLRARPIERLESRRLLSTYVINGTSGADSWIIDAQAHFYTVNGSTVFDPAVTDIQVNGLDDLDLLVIQRTDVPVVFNGG